MNTVDRLMKLADAYKDTDIGLRSLPKFEKEMQARAALLSALQELTTQEPVHKYEIGLPDSDSRFVKTWWAERKTTDTGITHKLSISVSEAPQPAQPVARG